jgi:hypothetical protein
MPFVMVHLRPFQSGRKVPASIFNAHKGVKMVETDVACGITV